MTEHLEPGAFSVFADKGMPDAPMYLLSFDKQGSCLSPQTRALALAQARSGTYSAVHVYSHGWNNVFKEAVAHYTEFFSEYLALRQKAAVRDGGYRPMIIGIIWPSTALLGSLDTTPVFAALAADKDDTDDHDEAVRELAAELTPASGHRLIELASKGTVPDADGSKELAELLLPILSRAEQGEALPQPCLQETSADDVLRNWGVAASVSDGRAGRPRKLPAGENVANGAPVAAGIFSFLNPREILRKATVFLMKDRAGVVGRNGVGDLLRDILSDSEIDLHLCGHSYGARVILSALASLGKVRKVASVLLLQPAVNAYCFADELGDGKQQSGAYRAALDHIRMPLHTTFSAQDRALSDFFKLALRRQGDIGDLQSAALDDQFAALGAVGPLGMLDGERETLAMLQAPDRYPRPGSGVRVVALDGSTQGISSHGDVRNAYTEWAMLNLAVMRS